MECYATDFTSKFDKISISFMLFNYISIFRIKNSDLPVNVTKVLNCSLGGKNRAINIQVSAETQAPTFKKDGNNIAYLLPSDFAVVENGHHIKN